MKEKIIAALLIWIACGNSNNIELSVEPVVKQEVAEVIAAENNIKIGNEISPKTEMSVEIENACICIGEEYGICPELLMAIIEKESAGDSYAVNQNTGCMGLMQLHPKYAQYYLQKAGGTDIYDIEDNIRAGCEILLELFIQYEDLPMVLMKYHGESDALKKYEAGECSNYAQDIIDRAYELERM